MDLASLCSLLASLRVEPNRTQFFQYEKVSLSCGSDWSVMRNTSLHLNQRSPQQNKSSWSFNKNIYYRDAGVYWCQSEEGQCGAVNITVTGGGVILESPVLPVLEGETVTLRCIINPRNKPVSEGTFQFYRDGSLVGNSSSGELTLSSVSESDSGLFSCGHEEELSMERPLVVLKAAGHPLEDIEDRDKAAPHSYFTSAMVAFPVVAASLALLCLALVCLWRKHKAEREKPEVNYSDVKVVHTPEPRRLKDLKVEDDTTFYSTLQLNFMK